MAHVKFKKLSECGSAIPFGNDFKFRMKVIVVLCDPIKRLKSDFVHTTKTTEPHAKKIKSYSKIEETVKLKVNIKNWSFI